MEDELKTTYELIDRYVLTYEPTHGLTKQMLKEVLNRFLSPPESPMLETLESFHEFCNRESDGYKYWQIVERMDTFGIDYLDRRYYSKEEGKDLPKEPEVYETTHRFWRDVLFRVLRDYWAEPAGRSKGKGLPRPKMAFVEDLTKIFPEYWHDCTDRIVQGGKWPDWRESQRKYDGWLGPFVSVLDSKAEQYSCTPDR